MYARSFNFLDRSTLSYCPEKLRRYLRRGSAMLLVHAVLLDASCTANAQGASPSPPAPVGQPSAPSEEAAPTQDLSRPRELPTGEPPQTGQAGPAEGLQDIIVTATRREASLQSVPAAISALNAGTLEAKGARNYEDYLNSVPGVSFARNGTRGNGVAVRGVSNGIRSTTSQTTGFYIDETAITSGAAFDPNLYDINRVEVLKGPQGTLYGSGSMGGTIRVILNKPKLDRIQASGEAEYGDVAHGTSNWLANAMLNVPVVEEKLAVRLVGGYRSTGGFVDNLGPPLDTDSNSDKRWIVRGMLLYRPTESTDVTLSGIYQHESFGSQSFHDFAYPEYTYKRYYPESGIRNDGVYSLALSHDLNDVNLTSITSYVTNERTNGQDSSFNARYLNIVRATGKSFTFGPGHYHGQFADTHRQVFSQEVRLTSRGVHKLDWLVGAFFSQTRANIHMYEDLTTIPQLVGYTVAQFGESILDDNRRQLAAFGEATYHLTDRLGLTAGLRYSRYDISSTNIGKGVLLGGGSLNGTVVTPLEAGASKLTQKYNVNYKVAPKNIVYAQAAQGFREGNALAPVNTSLCAPEFLSLGLPAQGPSQFLPDKLWSYEVGSKNSFLGNRLTLNAAAYYTDWKDIQQGIVLPVCRNTATLNAGRAVIKGAELSATVNPINGLILDASVAYTDARIKDAPSLVPALQNNRLPLVPVWAWNVNAQYDYDFSDSRSAFVRGDVTRSGSRWSELRGAGGALVPGYTLVAARLGMRLGRWSVALFATNLLDKKYALSYSPVSPAGETLGDPRVVGVNANVRF